MDKKSLGFEISKNSGNGFTCVRLHYTADPAKRTEEWKKKAFYGMDAKAINTEYEIGWESYAGQPVYGMEFSRDAHVLPARREPDLNANATLIRGWDFGGNHSCVVVQYIKGTIYVIDEYPNMGYNTRRIVKDVKEDCSLKYGSGFHYVDVIDPSGEWEGKTSEGKACATVMRELGLEIVPGIQEPTQRIDAVMKFLTGMNKGKPAILFNPGMKMLFDGFVGGYHYPDKETQNQKKNKPVKNEYSHIHDALQYACTRVLDVGDYERAMSLIDIANMGGYEYDL